MNSPQVLKVDEFWIIARGVAPLDTSAIISGSPYDTTPVEMTFDACWTEDRGWSPQLSLAKRFTSDTDAAEFLYAAFGLQDTA